LPTAIAFRRSTAARLARPTNQATAWMPRRHLVPKVPLIIAYTRSEAYRKESLLAGRPLPRIVDGAIIDADTESDAFRRIVAVMDGPTNATAKFICLSADTGGLLVDLSPRISLLSRLKTGQGWDKLEWKNDSPEYDRDFTSAEQVAEAAENLGLLMASQFNLHTEVQNACKWTAMRADEIFAKFKDEIPDKLKSMAGDTLSFMREAKAWMAEREERVRQEKENLKREAAEWIGLHGSDRLKRMYAGGYPCQGLYLSERATIELGLEKETTVVSDLKSEALISDRVEPSNAAMDMADAIRGKGYPNAKVSWVKKLPEAATGKEAVVVEKYLGHFRIVIFI